WQTICGELDGAMSQLGRDERDVLALRYLRGLSLEEVGRAIGITEDAARKRVFRAVERLRAVLAGSGIACSGVVLEQFLEQHAIGQAPAHLAVTAAAAANHTA